MMKLVQVYKWWIGSAVALSALGFFPLMGLPGFLLMEGFDRILRQFWSPTFAGAFGDSSWPIAIGFSVAMPLVFLVLVLGFFEFARIVPTSIAVGVSAAMTIVVLFAVYWFALVPVALANGGATQKTRNDEATFSETSAGIKQRAFENIRTLATSDSISEQEKLRVPFALTNLRGGIDFLLLRAGNEPSEYGLRAAQVAAISSLVAEIDSRRQELEENDVSKDFDSPAWARLRSLAQAALDAQ
ncbi:MAG: hypothetical protein V4760_12285 [Bdellovibrionota bacterium]